MGTVLKAVDPGLDRQVAIKVLHRELDDRHAARLRREAQALAKLSHPNVVQVYEVGDVDGQTFVAMELVNGQTLRTWMQREPRPSWQECIELFLQVGEGLAAAHERDLVHRDFKPANAIVDQKGRARVLDFGLARQVGERDQEEEARGQELAKTKPDSAPLNVTLTRPGSVLGTPAYMPPEQMEGREADGRSDQFSFCVSLYEAVYGERPFDGSTMTALRESTTSGNIKPVPRGTKVPARLRGVLLRGLAVDAGQRWPSMEALLTELRKVVAPPRRLQTRGLLGLVVAASVVGVGLWQSVGGTSERGSAILTEVDDQLQRPDLARPVVDADHDSHAGGRAEDPETSESTDQEFQTIQNDSGSTGNAPTDASNEHESTGREPAPATSPPRVEKDKTRRKRKPERKKDEPMPINRELPAKKKTNAGETVTAVPNTAPPEPSSTTLPRTLSSSETNALQRKAEEASRACGRKTGTFAPDVQVKFEVRPNGEVASATALSSMKASAEGVCAAKVVKKLRFPATVMGASRTWTLPLQ